MGLEISSPAKVNLFLRVCGKRDDGYHEIESLMHPVSLSDNVLLEPGGKGVEIRCPASDAPEDDSNLASRAAQLFYESLGRKAGLSIRLEKRIPIGAGLGGGSSNAAAVLKGLNVLEDSPFSTAQLAAMGARLGADVPFFVYGKPALATGFGEKITPFDCMYLHYMVIVYPGFAASTARVYKKCNLALTRCKKIHRVPDLTGGLRAVEDLLCNDLEEPAMALYPEITGVKAAFLETGAKGALMSGSGSSVFGLYDSRAQAVAAQERLREINSRWSVFLCRMLN